ncbi:hypothetical protein GCM10022214_01800 [Actinomadura miaoliensis]|uniref:Uncharacterized protein n=1 Tax=Actinomadura miaoliensis TaxID=430685 RepID=A0ABP7UX23_9ACTN
MFRGRLGVPLPGLPDRLIGQRDIPTVLTLVDKARDLAPGPSSFWYADLAGTRAKTLTLLGRRRMCRGPPAADFSNAVATSFAG